jgi:large subunit ribosomal protein L35
MHRRANRNHLLENKPSTRTRRLRKEGETSAADRKTIKRLLGK